jgi:hypothetical protein
VRFVDAARNTIVQDSQSQRRALALRDSAQPLIIPQPTPNKKDAALTFFLTHFVILGRSAASSRGFFELLPLVLSGERHDSAASLALSAVSTAMFDRWLGLDQGQGSSQKLFVDAITRLQTAIVDPTECLSRATVMAALTLQFHDNVSAILGLNNINRTHHDGSVALLRHQGQGSGYKSCHNPLAFHILNTEVSFAIRESRSLPATELSWLDYHNTSLNTSALLDIIGIDVANLQHEFNNMYLSSSSTSGEFAELFVKAATVDTRLKAWVSGVPTHWQPKEFDHIPNCSPPIIAYSGAFDVYPTVQIASIWNTWRIYRVITLRVLLGCLELSASDLDVPTNTSSFIRESFQQIVNFICRSIPFFLGNRTYTGTLHDFTDSNIFIPSHHHLGIKSELVSHQSSSGLLSQNEHFKHVISQGPWHILIPLSQLLNIFSQSHGLPFAQLLEDERHEWIRGQLVRARTLMGSHPGI